MPEANVVEWIRGKYIAVVGDLRERGRRRWAAAEAVSVGRGGIAAVAQATGISDRTIRKGIREIHAGSPPFPNRQRRPGGGRRSLEREQPKLMKALEKLVEPVSRGDPMSPLRWSCKSMRILAKELKRQKFSISHTKVGRLLKKKGYSLQANRKTREGRRQQQFPQPPLEVGTPAVRRPDGLDRGSLPFSAGHEQMEQDRASLVLPHHAQLARRSPGNA